MGEKITDQQLSRVIDWLKQKTDATCPFCGSRRWTVDNELSSAPAYHSGDAQVQLDRGHTMVLVTCDNCGYTAAFSSKKMAFF